MVTCDECGGECCKKLAFHVEAPATRNDFEDMKWYLYHEGAIVYIDNEGDWMVQVQIRCSKLDKNGRCTIYEKRPPICRDSKVEECEKNANEMSIVFRNVKELEEYMKEKKII